MLTTEHVTNKGQGTTRIPNKLANEKSPYLLQHVYNPVNWYPWGDEAFAKAKEENKPIFLSIGYSTCHWCHVMAHESFEDDSVAALLNQYFICIKVDKEERPDVDAIYMSVCQSITGGGGWPLTILMTPDQKPFYAGTYLPKEANYGMPGLVDLLEEVHTQWTENKQALVRSGIEITNVMVREFQDKKKTGTISKDLISLAVTQFNQTFDHRYGGFSEKPKFPTPHNLIFLTRYAALEKDEQALFMVETTLKNMYRGGIYDHIGFGFSRYSTDEKWLIPHFEKMLYDNALLTCAYLEAYQYTKDTLYKNVAEQILEYVRREMTDKDGGFYCAQDADSDGVEGRYYTFTPDEINKVLENHDGSYFNEYFGITKEGNFEGYSIPNRVHSEELKPDNERILRLSRKIHTYRLERAKLHRDDKILTSWNALMISAYAKAAKILQNQEYADIAKQAATFIDTSLTDENGNLFIRYREKDAANKGIIDDYAFYCMALIDLYEATFDVTYLSRAMRTADRMIDQFWDEENDGFYLYSKDAEQLIFRPKEVYDGAIPSGNSAAGYALQRLATITAKNKYQDYAHKQLNFLAGHVKDYPAGFSFSMIAFIQALYPSMEIVCIDSDNEDHHELLTYLSEHYEPNTTVLVKTIDNEEEIKKIAEYVHDYHTINDKTTYFICKNKSCSEPSNHLEPATMTQFME
ncbi:MAG: hypothetical protein K0S47_120 [Herbinix sp.]|jgi:uncharacterized protein YyaL (SSP411 family)|nr:hypothetical protein [Herbinix sp.]